jgi:YegS/Rv2252/BmrU family lipid kinase
VAVRTVVVLNPRSANGATGRRWRKLESRLRERLGDFEVEATREPGHAARIAAEAAGKGVQRLVVAGGDGTASEVANGVLGSGLADRVQIGLLPLGTGRDLPRTLGVPADVALAIDALVDGRTRCIDALKIRCLDPAGATRESYSINVVSFGLSGLTVERVANASRVVPGRLAFLFGAVSSILRYRVARVRIRAGERCVCDEALVLGAAANGRYFGGGMKIAPDAAADDGLLDLVIVRELSKVRLLASLPAIYRGTHAAKPVVSIERVRSVEATVHPGESSSMLVEADGESLGTLPATIEVLPSALTFFGVEPPRPQRVAPETHAGAAGAPELRGADG